MRHARTFPQRTLLNLLALSKIDEGLDKCETTHDIPTQRNKLFSGLALQKPAATPKAISVVSRVCLVGARRGK
jgi:hypothetical protein